MDLVDPHFESSIITFFTDRLIELVDKIDDLHIAQIVLKGHEGIEVCLQQSRQRGKERYVGICAALLPFIDRRCRYAQMLCDLLLRER